MKIGNKEVPVAGIANIVIILGGIFGSWFFADNYFAHADDIVAVSQETKVTKWTFEQSQNDLRMDILEDRIWREKKQPNPDQSQIERWERQIKKIEQRQQYLQRLQDQLILDGLRK